MTILKSTPVAQGKWKMRFAFQFEDTSVSLPAGQSFLLNGMEATLGLGGPLSALSFQVSYTVQQEVQWDNAGVEWPTERPRPGSPWRLLIPPRGNRPKGRHSP